MDTEELQTQSTRVLDEISRALVVDRAVLRRILTSVLSEGHVLLEDVPGTGKTLTARRFATALDLSFSRIQFTSDLVPTDVTGTYVSGERDGSFEFSQGPLFVNVVLADERNRASPKTQAALFEAMAEGHVTVDGETYPLPEPFFVIATQNPAEQGEETSSLSEAQKDRFLIKDSLGYPDEEGELELLDRRVDVGVSPFGSQCLFEAARTTAAVQGRGFVIPDDVRAVAHSTIAHRLAPTAEATVNNVDRMRPVGEVFSEVTVPRVNRKVRA
jgi:MoxR-like ATPase